MQEAPRVWQRPASELPQLLSSNAWETWLASWKWWLLRSSSSLGLWQLDSPPCPSPPHPANLCSSLSASDGGGVSPDRCQASYRWKV